MGKIILYIFIILSLTAGISNAADMQARTGFHYDWWDDNKENRADQFYIPLRFDASRDNLSFNVLTGYANTHVEFPDQGNQTLSHMLDTKLNISYGIPDRLPVDVVLGLGFNLPTGKTDFDQDELILVMDSDLISLNKFGEGYNVNPTVSIAKEWGSLAAGLGIGYEWRGEYDFSDNLKDFDPGDVVNALLELDYLFEENLQGRLFTHYVRYGKDKVEGEDFYQEGQLYILGAGINYSRSGWDADVSLKSIFRDKSKFQDTSGEIFTEDRNNHGDEYHGDVIVRYFLDDKTTLKSSLQALFVTKNAYSGDSSNFVGRREKFTLGLGANRILSDNLEAELSLQGFIMHTEEAEFPTHKDSNNYRGLSPAVYIINRF